jgi:MFS transporter, PPP family, 3-phenylpropionic acid transporter
MNAASDTTQQGSNHSTAAKDAAILRIYSYVFYSTMAVLVSYFPLYFADRGFTASQIGLLYAAGPAISIVANLLTGMASDKYRTIRKLLILLFAGQLIMLAALLQAESFGLVILVMTAFYFFQTPIQPLSDSLTLLSVSHTGRNYPSIRIFGSIGFALSAYLIGILLKQQGSGSTVMIAIGLVSLSLVLAWLLRDYQGRFRAMDFSGFFALVRQPRILFFFGTVLVLSVSHRMYEGFLALTLREMGASQQLVGTAWFTSAVSEIPILFLLGRYGHKLRDLPLLAFASLMYATRYFLLSYIEDPVYVIGLQLMHSVTFGIFFSTALRYMTHLIPDEYRASGQALYAIVWAGIAGVISGTAGGAFFQAHGYQAFYSVASMLAAAAFAGFVGMAVWARRR